MSAQSKKAQQLARQLFKTSLVDGAVSAERVAGVLEYVEKLDIEDQQYLQEIIHRRLIDAKRMAIVSRAKQAKANVQKNKSRSGTAKDLLADLNG